MSRITDALKRWASSTDNGAISWCVPRRPLPTWGTTGWTIDDFAFAEPRVAQIVDPSELPDGWCRRCSATGWDLGAEDLCYLCDGTGLEEYRLVEEGPFTQVDPDA